MDGLEDQEYNNAVQQLREQEYPMLKDTTYMDHAGTTLIAKSTMDRFSNDMVSNLYGNPHSISESSQRSTKRIEDTRLRLLRLFRADPTYFDVVFVANATAGVKLVMDAFRGCPEGFNYVYHKSCHTSLVGIRECATEHRCFESDQEVEQWIDNITQESTSPIRNQLFAYPAQSNMNGRRLPLEWSSKVCVTSHREQRFKTYSLLDAAALMSTSPLDLSDAAHAPDFTVVSLYKTFGFPDLGALLVRKDASNVFAHRKYFGGGTVDMVLCVREQWHARKSETLHEQLEDGTLPIHSIMVLDSAMTVHTELFGSLERSSRHALFLARQLYENLSALKHSNGMSVCEMYKDEKSSYSDPQTQGPIVSFNIRNANAAWISNHEVEKLAAVKKIDLRTGGLCNPGGIATSLGLEPWEMKQNFSAGQRCGNENDIMFGKPTGMIRLSLGAMSTMADVMKFTDFMHEFFIEAGSTIGNVIAPPSQLPTHGGYIVESVTIYPIKSCAGWKVTEKSWPVHKEGLGWDREWCLVHCGTATTLSQKKYPRMALLRPEIDLRQGLLRVRLHGDNVGGSPREITVPLSADPRFFSSEVEPQTQSTRVCGDNVPLRRYESGEINEFFSQALGVACQLARLPPSGSSRKVSRYAKAHLQQHQLASDVSIPGAFPQEQTSRSINRRPIHLSNESPILVVSRSSLNRLNEMIKLSGGKAARADVFRANIVVAEDFCVPPGTEQPYVEDRWRYIQVGGQYFEILGSCRRCQMVCIDQQTGEKDEEPFVTLAKTRRFDGKVFFGQHACHVSVPTASTTTTQNPTIGVGDAVRPIYQDQVEDMSFLEALGSI